MLKHILQDIEKETMEFSREERKKIMAYVNQSGTGIFNVIPGIMDRPKFVSPGYKLMWENIGDSPIWSVFFYRPRVIEIEENRIYVGQLCESMCNNKEMGGFIYLYLKEQDPKIQYSNRFKEYFSYSYKGGVEMAKEKRKDSQCSFCEELVIGEDSYVNVGGKMYYCCESLQCSKSLQGYEEKGLCWYSSIYISWA